MQFKKRNLLILLFSLILFPEAQAEGLSDILRVKAGTSRCVQCDLQGMVASKCTLEHINFYRSNFYRANLQECSFRFSNLYGTQFRYANLRGVDFQNALMIRINLDHADLSRANLKGANLEQASLKNTTLSGSTWIDGRICKEGSIGICN